MRRSIFLAVAFAALLFVTGVSSLAVWRNAREARERLARLHEAHMRAGSALVTIRTNVYRTAILNRDYLLDPDPGNAQQYIEQFSAIHGSTEQALRTVESSGLGDEQLAAVGKLRHELERYWDPTEIMLDWTPAEKRVQRAQMLKERLKLRKEVFNLANQVEDMIAANFAAERQRTASADRDFEASLAWTSLAALLLGMAIAAATVFRMMTLERISQDAEGRLRLLSGQLRTAQEQERKSLSRELHDQVGQMLTGVRMELAAMARLVADTNGELSLRITRAKGTVEQTLRAVRNIAMLLRPSMLDDFGLSAALSWLVKEMSRTSGIDVTSSIDNAVDQLPEAHRTCIYRLVQEALTNASRHSGARSAQVTVRAGESLVIGSVSDDGGGFDVTSRTRASLGLLGMEERVRELGGTVHVQSTPGRGTRVEMRLPRPAPAGQAATDPRAAMKPERAGANAGAPQ